MMKAALFDMDGVLYNSMGNHAIAWNRAMMLYGMRMPREEAYMHEGRTGNSTINIVSCRERGREATPEEIREMYRVKSDIFNVLPTPDRMPGAYELLLKVKASGIIPVIVTGSGQHSMLERVSRSFPGIFTAGRMVTAFDVKHGKPDPEPYLMGLQKAGVDASEAIVVENAPLGIKAGVAAGIYTVAVNTGPLPDEVLLEQGASRLYHSMFEFCDDWEHFFSSMSK